MVIILINYFFPTPGASGAAELSSAALMSLDRFERAYRLLRHSLARVHDVCRGGGRWRGRAPRARQEGEDGGGRYDSGRRARAGSGRREVKRGEAIERGSEREGIRGCRRDEGRQRKIAMREYAYLLMFLERLRIRSRRARGENIWYSAVGARVGTGARGALRARGAVS